MPRTPRGPIDLLATYTFIDPANPPDPPQNDYYVTADNLYTIWGVGLVTFGLPTAAQQAWLSDSDNLLSASSLSTFPTDWVSFGFPYPANTSIPLWELVTWVDNQVLLTEQGVSNADAWSIGGLSGTGTFYFSDISVTNGTSTGETLNGGSAAETLNGLGGDDTLNGGGGSDALHGGDGNDTLNGGDGIDRLWGDDGNDILNPGSDAAFIYITGGVNRAGVYSVDGGLGTDTLVLDYLAATTSQSINGDQVLASPQVLNVEQLAITGSPFADFLTGSSGNDQLYGGDGFDFLSGGGGNDLLDAGAPGASSVTTIGPGGHSNADALSLDHLFTAGSGDPSVNISIHAVQTKVSDTWGLRPQAGGFYSFTVGAAGDQATIAFTVDNELSDVAEFHIKDANGVSVFDWTSLDPPPPITFSAAGTYYLQVVIFQGFNPWDTADIDLTFSLQGADVLTSNVLAGGTGNDTYVVNSPTDQVIEKPGQGKDTIQSSVSWILGANVENLTLTGSTAIDGTGNNRANHIIGNSAANVISGGGGGDIITGGGGADTLSGGAGRDIFRFTALSDSAPGAADLILDFASRPMVGTAHPDRIDLSAIDANVNKAGNQAFTFVSNFTGHAGQLYSSYDSQALVTHIYMDVNGDGVADMTIDLAGQVPLSAADFLL